MHGYRIKEARFWYLVKVVIKCVVSNQRMWSKENPFFRGSFLRLSAKEFSAWFYRSNGVLFWTHWAAITFESSWLFWMPWIRHHKSEYTFMTEWISLVGIRIVFFYRFHIYVKKMKSTPTSNLKLRRVLFRRCARHKKKLCSNKI